MRSGAVVMACALALSCGGCTSRGVSPATPQEEARATDPFAARYMEAMEHYLGENAPLDGRYAVAVLEELARAGHGQSQYTLGSVYYSGKHVPRDYERGRAWLTTAAKQGHREAQLALGELYQEGYGVEQNLQEAVRWYRKAADQHSMEAQLALGRAYSLGSGVSQNDAKACQWWRKAGEQGCEEARLLYAFHYIFSDDDKDRRTLEKEGPLLEAWLREAAENGSAMAQYGLGCLYAQETGLGPDAEQARYWLELARDVAYPGAAEALLRLDGLEEPTVDAVPETGPEEEPFPEFFLE